MSGEQQDGAAKVYPLAEVLDDGDLIHHARPVGRFGSRIKTRCGLQGRKTGRDGGAWCPECKARQAAEAAARDAEGTDGPADCGGVARGRAGGAGCLTRSAS